MNRLALALGVALLALPGGAASAADWIGVLPGEDSPCADQRVIKRLGKIIAYRMENVYHTELGLSQVTNIQQRRYEPEEGMESPIARLYCRGQAHLTDGDSRTMWYFVEYGAGFDSIGDNVEVCLAGYERWYVYGGRCRAAQ